MASLTTTQRGYVTAAQTALQDVKDNAQAFNTACNNLLALGIYHPVSNPGGMSNEVRTRIYKRRGQMRSLLGESEMLHGDVSEDLGQFFPEELAGVIQSGRPRN
jgi:hypothetical protein